jgi:fibronectin type 3 domain-containing protein
VSAANSSSNEFVLSGLTLPATIAPGQSAAYSVKFAPNATGTATGTLTFASNASNSNLTQALSGTGGAATQHIVHLTWTASTNVSGYNIYRSTVSGGPYSMINSSLDATTGYADSTVTAGQTYYYVVTAVDSNSKESGYSNQTTVVVPSP